MNKITIRQKMAMYPIQKNRMTLSILLFMTCFLSSCVTINNDIHFKKNQHSLLISQNNQQIQITSYPGNVIEVKRFYKGQKQLPSFSLAENVASIKSKIIDEETSIKLINGDLTALINKKSLDIEFYRGNELLTKQNLKGKSSKNIELEFEIESSEKILGGGERVLGMNRRGNRMPLYNKAHYGYSTESNQMYYSLPAIISSKKYLLLFDNSASGFLDIDKSKKNKVKFEAVSGQDSYFIIAAKNYPELINSYVGLTGKQPMPSRWTLGNHASRFGYKSQEQVKQVIDMYHKEDIPVDSIIIDLYWFGPDIKGHVGNLDWDKAAFPEPIKMIKELQQKGVKTIVITEPFILTSSKRWDEAIAEDILVKDYSGNAKRFDFYFGNTGLIDVFNKKAIDWFGNIYQDLFEQGIAGTWGDLGEPEVHPDDSIHYLSDSGMSGNGQFARGDEIHNAYGHQWAKLVYQKQRQLQPEERPFIMMRSGFAGSQRYGIIPWTGDVSRSWGGLKPQVELSLQMGLLGLGYTHSDLGGFAGGEQFDKELYLRWLQYGVFQPVFRPHAQDNIAPEPVFHDQETKDIARRYIKLRYQLLPYIYTLSYLNSTQGMPLMRPLFFEDDTNSDLFDRTDSYLWGDAFLVSPITEPNKDKHTLMLPAGVWFDFWDDSRYLGDQMIELDTQLDKLPVFVRAGSFIPMVDAVQTSANYSSRKLALHYYADESTTSSDGLMYEDDGKSFSSIEKGNFELLKFNANQKQNKTLSIDLIREGGSYQGIPESRAMTIKIHNWKANPLEVKFSSLKRNKVVSKTETQLNEVDYYYNEEDKILTVTFSWNHQDSRLLINN